MRKVLWLVCAVVMGWSGAALAQTNPWQNTEAQLITFQQQITGQRNQFTTTNGTFLPSLTRTFRFGQLVVTERAITNDSAWHPDVRDTAKDAARDNCESAINEMQATQDVLASLADRLLAMRTIVETANALVDNTNFTGATSQDRQRIRGRLQTIKNTIGSAPTISQANWDQASPIFQFVRDLCLGKSYTPPVKGACGPANGGSFSSAPTTGLCSAGAATAVTISGSNFVWTCLGENGGTNASCSAVKVAAPVNGQCGSANGGTFTTAPTSGLCAKGTASAVTGSGPWSWFCSGLNGGTNSGTCSANPPVVNGNCGSANGVPRTNAPTTPELCSSGNPTAVSGTGPWNWSCTGSFGGATAACNAPKQAMGGTCHAHITFQVDACSAADVGCVTYHSFERKLKADSAYGCVEALISSHNYWEFFDLYPWNDKAAALGCTRMNGGYSFPYAMVDGNGSPPNSRACYIGPLAPGENIAPYKVGDCEVGGKKGILLGVGQAMIVIYPPATCPAGVTPPTCPGGFKPNYQLGNAYWDTPATCLE